VYGCADCAAGVEGVEGVAGARGAEGGAVLASDMLAKKLLKLSRLPLFGVVLA
jgi:hypothetical protein